MCSSDLNGNDGETKSGSFYYQGTRLSVSLHILYQYGILNYCADEGKDVADGKSYEMDEG